MEQCLGEREIPSLPAADPSTSACSQSCAFLICSAFKEAERSGEENGRREGAGLQRVRTTWVSHSGLAFHLCTGHSVPTGAEKQQFQMGTGRAGFVNLATSPCFFGQVTKLLCVKFLNMKWRLFKNPSSLKPLPGLKPRILGLYLPFSSFLEHTTLSPLHARARSEGHRSERSRSSHPIPRCCLLSAP